MRLRLPDRGTLLILALAGSLFAALALWQHAVEARARSAGVSDHLGPDGKPRPIAEVVRAIAQSKLVTVEIDTIVSTESTDSNWRGEVSARVRAPARLLYGTDLSNLGVDAVTRNPLGNSYLVRVPPPERIATEICSEHEETEVQVGWLRLRSRAGEYYLGRARVGLHEAAQLLELNADDAAMVRRTTLAQVRALVQAIVGPDATVIVGFSDGKRSGDASAAEPSR